MSSYFNLILDTTNPVLTILAIPYTSIGIDYEIIIESNEPLGTYQDVYFIDSKGVKCRIDVAFSEDKLSARGTTQFLDCTPGKGKIYATLCDEVDNKSTATFSVEIYARFFCCHVGHKIAEQSVYFKPLGSPVISDTQTNIDISNSITAINLNTSITNIKLNTNVTKLEVRAYECSKWQHNPSRINVL